MPAALLLALVAANSIAGAEQGDEIDKGGASCSPDKPGSCNWGPESGKCGPQYGPISGVGGIGSDALFRLNCYEKKQRYYQGILAADVLSALQGIDERVIAQYNNRNSGYYKVIIDGKPTPASNVMSNGGRAALTRTAQSHSIIINQMQDADPATFALADGLYKSDIGVRPNINLYSAPADMKGLSAHHDPQDVFIIQVTGSKLWTVCDPIGPGQWLPTRVSDDPKNYLFYRYNASQLEGTNCGEYILRPGDVLYMPRGTIHAPETIQDRSVHLTVGIDGDFTWRDFLTGVARTGNMRDLDRIRAEFRKNNEIWSSRPSVRASKDAYIDCMRPRDLNKLVPHAVLVRILSRAAGAGTRHVQPLDKVEPEDTTAFEKGELPSNSFYAALLFWLTEPCCADRIGESRLGEL